MPAECGAARETAAGLRREREAIELDVRRALLGYVLQRLGVDTTPDHG